jgi:hypothetical protein
VFKKWVMGEAAPTTTPCRMDNVWAFTSRNSVNKTHWWDLLLLFSRHGEFSVL